MVLNDDPEAATSWSARRPRLLGDLATLVVIFGILLTVYLLPADTSLRQVREAGRIAACMPDRYPPLVTGDAEAPGFDVELLRAVAARLGVTLTISPNSAIGRDFNPRNWRVTRAQCQILAGGVVLSWDVRSFLDTVPTPLSTGWAVVSPTPVPALDGLRVGVFPGLTGLDRIQLGRYLRDTGATPKLLPAAADLEAGLQSGEIDAAVTEGLAAAQLAETNGWTVQWLPPPFERLPLGLGLWRGDLTLGKAIAAAMRDLERDGSLEALQDKYRIGTIDGILGEGP